jgi:superfamily II DNA or RNA helicase
MSIAIPFSDFSEEIKSYISSTYLVQPPPSRFETTPAKVKCYRVDAQNKRVLVPFSAYEELYEDSNDVFSDVSPSQKFSQPATTCIVPYTLETDPKHTRDQNIVLVDAIERLEKRRSVLLGLFTGFGKTTVAIYLAAKLGLKTLVLCHLDIVNRRWASDFSEKTNLKVKLISSATSLPPGYDVYIVGVQKGSNIDPAEYVNAGIGTVVVDEVHICTLTCFTDTLLRIQPQYLIGLSATPGRKDGMHMLFDLFFGKDNIIVRSEIKNFVVVKCKTSFEPLIETTWIKGKETMKWATAKKSIEENEERWRVIADIAQSHPERCILILSDLRVQSNGIFNELKSRGESVDIFTDTKKSYDTSARILVGGTKKCGTGFDDPRFTMLILASDMTSVEQAEGRLRCADALLYDIVDNHFLFENHFKKRLGWYTQRGATMQFQRK